ncbi:MAG TPA: START domain-containing protein [Bdellovibrionota bacterium]|nr:START domain-containing protein [Bdellovibrionota bacterium]
MKTKNSISKCVLSLCAALVAVTSQASPAPVVKDWEKQDQDNGIITYHKEIPGSDIVAFRGEGMIDAPIAKVANILIDTPRKMEWVAKIAEAKDVRNIGPYERIEYNHTSSGFFLVKDRDFVFHAKADFDDAHKAMIFSLSSVKDALMPERGPVRGELTGSRYILTSKENGTKTYVEVEINADPKGDVPKWLVNLFQKSWPRTTLENMRKQAAKKDVVEHPGVKEHFAALEAKKAS